MLVERMGHVELDANIKLKNVLYVPQFSCNLISVHKLTRDSNCTLTYDENRCVMQDRTTKRTIGSGVLHEGVYILKGPMQASSFTVVQQSKTKLWHSRMGHPSDQALQKISHLLRCNFVFNKDGCCDICHQSKQCRFPFNISNNKAEEPFHLIHCDLWGKYGTAEHNGSHYFLTIVDDYTRATWVYLMKYKTETLEMLKRFCYMVKRQFNTREEDTK